MQTKLFSTILAFAFAIAASTAWAQGLLDQAEEDYVQPTLVADVSSVEPGATFRLGVLYKMDPEWHIYWQFPGDSGQAPEIEWRLPAGFTAGPIQWPVPERMTLSDIVGYGYNEQVLLFMTVTAPRDLPAGPIEIGASTSWLSCREECVPGGPKELKLALTAGARKDSAEKALFDTFQALVPKPANKELTFKYDGPKTADAGTSVAATITVTPAAGWKIDTAAVSAHEPSVGTYPLFSEPWKTDKSHAGKPVVTESEARFAWVFTALPKAPAATAPIALVARVPLTGPNGEKQVGVGAFSLPLEVAGAAPAPAATATAKPAVKTAAAEKLPAAGEPIFSFLKEERADDNSFLKLLLFAFLGGMILNIMPCVLPVLSLKVMSFVRQAGEEPGRVWRLGMTFGAGVVASFMALALVVIGLKIAGTQVGWGFQMQEPRFVIVMTAVVVALGLSLFGVYEIGLPGSAAGTMDRASRKEGYAGAFFNGILITALATPCTAPMLGPALGFAFLQPASVILLFFLAISLGLAFPYVLLTSNPRLIKWMPKPGAWMNTFKQFMGFLMLGTAIWLLWILSGQVGSDGVIVTLAFMLLLGVACWLIGHAFDYGTKPAQQRLYSVLAIVLVAGGYFYLPERYLERFNTTNEQAPAKQAVAAAGEIPWEPFSIARVEDLVAQKRLVFLDFTADWCATCKVNEAGVMSTDRIRQAFEKYNVAPVRGDWTRRDKTIGAVLSYFKQGGVPLYVIFPAGHPEDYILLSQILTIGQVEDALAKASK
ncbi:MAG: thioredoxin family protein [Candidatus Sumerlaeia bacterium]